jgi:purine-binding chemotaxis protein CheW
VAPDSLDIEPQAQLAGDGQRPLTLLVFQLGAQRLALRLEVVQRVLAMVEIRSLPGAPAPVTGLVNIAGRVIPVMDLRPRFGVASRAVELSDVLILADAGWRTVALVADGVIGLVARGGDDVTPMASMTGGLPDLAGVVKLDDGLVLLHDVDKVLSSAQRQQLDRLLAADPQAQACRS